jgi:hypothetical protein
MSVDTRYDAKWVGIPLYEVENEGGGGLAGLKSWKSCFFIDKQN